jgi:hypothetical protein
MNKMVRQQLFVTAEQKRRLKTRAALTGLSEGEIIRRGIDRELEDKSAEKQRADWKDAWRQAAGMWKDRDDIDAFYAERRKQRRKRRERIQKAMRGD